jgi:AcrR family transcriptional regulator
LIGASSCDRLLEAVIELAARDGYARLTVEKILVVAGVSRATFYQYFRSADDCLSPARGVFADARRSGRRR